MDHKVCYFGGGAQRHGNSEEGLGAGRERRGGGSDAHLQTGSKFLE